VGRPASYRVSRVRHYSGAKHWVLTVSATGLSPAVALCSKQLRIPRPLQRWSADHQAWSCNPSIATAAALARCWFGLIPVRSPLLRDYCLFLGVHEMVQFPRFPLPYGSHGARPWGCPIRRSWAHSLRAAPPRVSSLCHVLHRHAAPRHPPSAHRVFPAAPTAHSPASSRRQWAGSEQSFHHLHLVRYTATMNDER
jgi:hypothetical protein